MHQQVHDPIPWAAVVQVNDLADDLADSDQPLVEISLEMSSATCTTLASTHERTCLTAYHVVALRHAICGNTPSAYRREVAERPFSPPDNLTAWGGGNRQACLYRCLMRRQARRSAALNLDNHENE